MKTSLLDYIVCPLCGSDLILRNEEHEGHTGDILSGKLICAGDHRFPVDGYVPRLIDMDFGDEDKRQTKNSFAYKWKRFEKANFEETELKKKRKWYLDRYGWRDPDDFKAFLSKKSFILDAGTGIGRDAGWFAELSDGQVFGVDIGASIDIAYKHYGSRSNLHLIQADLASLPFRDGFFDFISCDQTIHHTPDPEKSFKHLVKHLRSGGEICVYTYKKKAPIREFCDDYIREYSTNLSEEDCLKLSEAITLFGKSLSDLDIEIEVPEDIPILQMKAGKHSLQRFFYWNIFKCFWTDDRPFDYSVSVNFDWYHPKHAYRFSPDEIRGWFEEEGLETTNFNVIESGISIRGRKD